MILLRENKEWVKNFSNSISKSMKKFYKNGGENGFKDKHHSEETKKKIGRANSIHQNGKGNSQYSTMWIYSLEEKISKKIPKGSKIPEGWLKGRKIKF